MNVVKEIQRINRREIASGDWSDTGSWHAQYKDTAWIFAGNLPYDLSEGDIVCIFSQYGEIIHIELIRDKQTGKSRGFAFLQYEDQRSTILAVDNLNGSQVLSRTLRVDHSYGPKPPKRKRGENGEEIEEEEEDYPKMNVAPPVLTKEYRKSTRKDKY
ncbi:RNA-binding motif protein, X-linked 2 [Apophysomyces ossiformis]|uniref:RNA-binding motif protein, X-linked 2 n=1 Tax=Apophysomyces ossiformis TaxID=679940 RepID=A0A8H7BJW7_9FUNG|nr:RNA-binding motif protein, X-linked 2 [Apophysomyces ossiformis]